MARLELKSPSLIILGAIQRIHPRSIPPGMTSANGVTAPPDHNASNRIIQGLWIGSPLSVMEQLSINSFLRNGHEYHLYTYEELPNVPSGTVIKNATEILPASTIFQYRDRPSYAGFANLFRYKLLFEHGGWWADADTVCLRPFDFSEPYVFSSELKGTQETVNNGIIKAERNSEAMFDAWRSCLTKPSHQLVWGETGPKLMAEIIERHGLEEYRKPYYAFCPVSEWNQLLQPYVAAVDERAFAVHLWNEMWRLSSQDKNAKYHPACIYEQLKSRYL